MLISHVRRSSRMGPVIAQLLLLQLAWIAPDRVLAQDAAALLAPSQQSFHAWQVPPPQGAAQA